MPLPTVIYCRPNFLTKMNAISMINDILPTALMAEILAFFSVRDVGLARVSRQWRKLFSRDPDVLKAQYQDESLSPQQQTLLFQRILDTLQPGVGCIERLASFLHFTKKSNIFSGSINPKDTFKVCSFLRQNFERTRAELSEEAVQEIQMILNRRLENLAEVQTRKRLCQQASQEILQLDSNFPIVFFWGNYYIKAAEARLNVLEHLYSHHFKNIQHVLASGDRTRSLVQLLEETPQEGHLVNLLAAEKECAKGGGNVFFLSKLFQAVAGEKLGKVASDNIELIKHLGYADLLKKRQKSYEDELTHLQQCFDDLSSEAPLNQQEVTERRFLETRMQEILAILTLYKTHLPRFLKSELCDIIPFATHCQNQFFACPEGHVRKAEYENKFEHKELQDLMSKIVGSLKDLNRPSWNEMSLVSAGNNHQRNNDSSSSAAAEANHAPKAGDMHQPKRQRPR